MTDILIAIILVISVISLVINFVLIRKSKNQQNYDNCFNDINKKLYDVTTNLNQQQSLIRQELNQTIQDNIQNLSKVLIDNQMANQRVSSENQLLSSQKLENSINEKQNSLKTLLSNDMKYIDEKLQNFIFINEKKLDNIRNIIDTNINTIKNEIESRMNLSANDNIKKLDDIKKSLYENLCNIQNDINKQFLNQIAMIERLENHIKEKQDNIQNVLNKSLSDVEKRLNTFSIESEQKLENIRGTVAGKLTEIQNDTNKSLDKMRDIVEEKMQKTLEDRMTKSFSLVNERLEQVYKGLGEMQNLAVNVGDLKKVLTNVKSRGIVGEIQLGAILEEILSPQQFDKNVKTKKSSNTFVEYAIKLPGDNNNIVYLPIDSKFPGDTYSKLRDAYETGDTELIKKCSENLISTFKAEAKDIHDKYIDPPHTTEFAIMFLPFEGLYSEAVNRGMVELLQKEYKVNIAGPSTMASLLNSLQMGFKTLAVQKRSGEVWKVLGAVKTEFDNFEKVLSATQKSLEKANKELDSLVGTRTRAIQRKLKNVTEFVDNDEAINIIEN